MMFPREEEIGVGADLHIKYILYLLKTFPPSPQYPVCLVAALAEPSSAKSNTMTNFYTTGHYSNRGVVWRSVCISPAIVYIIFSHFSFCRHSCCCSGKVIVGEYLQ